MGNFEFKCPDRHANCVSHPQSDSQTRMHPHFVRVPCPLFVPLTLHIHFFFKPYDDATVNDGMMLSSSNSSLNCASILQPATPPHVVTFESGTIPAPICLNRMPSGMRGMLMHKNSLGRDNRARECGPHRSQEQVEILKELATLIAARTTRGRPG